MAPLMRTIAEMLLAIGAAPAELEADLELAMRAVAEALIRAGSER